MPGWNLRPCFFKMRDFSLGKIHRSWLMNFSNWTRNSVDLSALGPPRQRGTPCMFSLRHSLYPNPGKFGFHTPFDLLCRWKRLWEIHAPGSNSLRHADARHRKRRCQPGSVPGSPKAACPSFEIHQKHQPQDQTLLQGWGFFWLHP